MLYQHKKTGARVKKVCSYEDGEYFMVEDQDGNEYTWNTDYAFSLAVTSVEGDWVNAQFTSTHTNPESELEAEVFYEFYHIVDGKIQEWSQFKRDVLK